MRNDPNLPQYRRRLVEAVTAAEITHAGLPWDPNTNGAFVVTAKTAAQYPEEVATFLAAHAAGDHRSRWMARAELWVASGSAFLHPEEVMAKKRSAREVAQRHVEKARAALEAAEAVVQEIDDEITRLQASANGLTTHHELVTRTS